MTQNESNLLNRHLEETVLAGEESIAEAKPQMDLVEGSSLHFSRVTQSLLRYRLRLATLAMFGVLGIYLVWHTYQFFFTDHVAEESPMLLVFHAATVAILGISGLMLCPRCDTRIGLLRAQEVLVFGLPGLLMLFLQHHHMQVCAREFNIVQNPTAGWMLLIFIYALFIPNSWQRAAVAISLLVAAPVALVLYEWSTDTSCSMAIGGNPELIAEVALKMIISGGVATFGVFTIGTLRSEAFQAQQLGQYHLGRLLGAGGMGEVYLGHHQLMKRPCAIKVIRAEKAGDTNVLQRFEREVHASSKLSHWNNIDIYDYGRTKDGTFYYVMEYLPGLTVADLVRRFGHLPPARAVYLWRQICDALQEAHSQGMIHRDIKPANVFAAKRGGFYDVGKLLDFGLAKPLQSTSEDSDLTQEGMITGSPLYMSPEQASGEQEPDARSDIYSMGILAYYMVTGRAPFEYNQPIKVIIAHAHETVVPPSQLVDDVPADLDAIILKCLQKAPEDRFQSAAELAQALDECEVSGQWTHREATTWWTEADSAEDVGLSSHEHQGETQGFPAIA